MQGRWDWLGNQFTSIKTRINQTYTSVTSTFHQGYTFVTSTISYIASKPLLQNSAYSFSLQAWEGFMRFSDPSNVIQVAQSPKTMMSLKESVKTNSVYFLEAMVIAFTQASIVNAILSNDKESWFSAVTAINMLAVVCQGTVMLHRYWDNTLINLVIAKNAADENHIENHFKGCGCDDGALITAGLFSSINLTGKLILVWVLSHLPIVKYIAPISRISANGETLVEYPYSSVGMCTKHRTEALIKNNAYSLGVGASFVMVGELINYFIFQQTGLSGFFISNAVYSAIYPFFLTSVLLRDKPLPGKQEGFDFFYLQRHGLQVMSGQIGKQILPFLQNLNNNTSVKSKNAVNWNKILEKSDRLLKFPKWILSKDVYGKWGSWKDIQTNPSTILFFKEYYPLIKQQLENIIKLREQSVVGRIVPVLPDSMTNLLMSKEYQAVIKIIFNENLDRPLQATLLALKDINSAQETAQLKATIYDKEKWKKAVAREQLGTSEPIVQSANPLPIAERSVVKFENPELVIIPLSGSKELIKVGLFSPKEPHTPPVKKVSQPKKRRSVVNIVEDYDGQPSLGRSSTSGKK